MGQRSLSNDLSSEQLRLLETLPGELERLSRLIDRNGTLIGQPAKAAELLIYGPGGQRPILAELRQTLAASRCNDDRLVNCIHEILAKLGGVIGNDPQGRGVEKYSGWFADLASELAQLTKQDPLDLLLTATINCFKAVNEANWDLAGTVVEHWQRQKQGLPWPRKLVSLEQRRAKLEAAASQLSEAFSEDILTSYRKYRHPETAFGGIGSYPPRGTVIEHVKDCCDLAFLVLDESLRVPVLDLEAAERTLRLPSLQIHETAIVIEWTAVRDEKVASIAMFKSSAPPRTSEPTSSALKPTYSPWIDAAGFIPILKENKIATSDSTIKRKKREWSAEEQPGSNHQRFRFPLASLKELKIRFPSEWDQK